jgi:hypothetical protein
MNSTEPDMLLDSALGRFKLQTAALHTPPRVEQALQAAFAARKHQQRSQNMSRYIRQKLTPFMTMTATAAVAAWIVMTPMVKAPAEVKFDTTSLDAQYAAAADTPFIAVASLEQIEQEPTPHLVQADVPLMMLASAGLPVDPENAGNSVRAEMLVSASGQTLAMRLMP